METSWPLCPRCHSGRLAPVARRPGTFACVRCGDRWTVPAMRLLERARLEGDLLAAIVNPAMRNGRRRAGQPAPAPANHDRTA